MNQSIKASDLKCSDCKNQAEVFFPVFDPDIPSYPYCRECVEKRRIKLIIDLSKLDD